MQSLIGIELENGGVLIKFVQTAAETGGAAHVQEARYAPGSKPPPYHCHPRQEERFSILSGALAARIGGVERTIAAGEVVTIDRGVYHLMYNPGDAPTTVLWETRPALRTAELFYSMSQAARGRSRPRLVDAAAILHEYRDEMQLASPPLPVQRLVFACLAPFGRRAVMGRTG